MEPWWKVVNPRKEVREGRSFDPDEFAIALEQVVAGTAPSDYKDPVQFFSRTCFTRALKEHAGMVLRRLSGQTENAAPVLTLVTQFGGGKTHTLAALYHLARNGKKAEKYPGVADLLSEAGLSEIPKAKVAVFVGNAWDPEEGKETPWIDVARQLAGVEGVEALGTAAKTTPPGTEALGKVFKKAGGSVLVLFDEVLNFINRHRDLDDSFYAFLQNLTVAMTGTTQGAAVISLPRSQIEMTERDQQWQDRITKVVRRVAKDLIANDEAEISEVIRKRLFEDLGSEKIRKNVAKAYAEWCYERRAQLPPEWTAVDTASTEAKAKEFLQRRFESCYPFHPATLSVFQRKWQALPHYQQTRGTLAMLAQWISCAGQEGYRQARREALITLGSAPLNVSNFRAVVLGQLGEPRLSTAIETDISGEHSHARALDADAKGGMAEIHRRVGTTIFFESCGGQRADRVAMKTELRFALGEPEMDTTSIDSAAMALESKGFFVSRVGSDGFKIYHKATVRKAVNDRRASLDEESEIKPAMRQLVKEEFQKDASIPLTFFPEDGSAVQDSPRLSLVVMDPEVEWTGGGKVREQVKEWMRQRGKEARLYPGALIWCLKKPGRQFREKTELLLSWRRVAKDEKDGLLGDYDRADRAEIAGKQAETLEAVRDEIWSGYRYLVLADNGEADGLRVIDLGEGHSSEAKSLCNKIKAALMSGDLLNEKIGAGYIDRHWPPALKASGEWPLASLRQAFLTGILTRLLDPDAILRKKIMEFADAGDFGVGSGKKLDGTYDRLWFHQMMAPEEVTFESDIYLIKREKAEALKSGVKPVAPPGPEPPLPGPEVPEAPPVKPVPGARATVLRLFGQVPPEVWNRLGTKLIPKLKQGTELRLGLEISVTVDANQAALTEAELKQVLQDLDLADHIRIEKR